MASVLKSIIQDTWQEVRITIAEWILWQAFKMAPWGKVGNDVKIMIADYFYRKANELKNRKS